eukprot:1013829-Rhodomonas_salina.2
MPLGATSVPASYGTSLERYYRMLGQQRPSRSGCVVRYHHAREVSTGHGIARAKADTRYILSSSCPTRRTVSPESVIRHVSCKIRRRIGGHDHTLCQFTGHRIVDTTIRYGSRRRRVDNTSFSVPAIA